MKVQIRLIAATIGLTILIWAFADQQGYRTIDFPVAVKISTQPDVVPEIEGAEVPNLLYVTVAARGPNALIRELDLTRGSAFEVLIPVTENLSLDRPRPIDIRDEVAQATGEHRLQFLSVNPSAITVKFDRRVRVNLQVVADPGPFREALGGDVEVEPREVAATVLNSQLKGIVLEDRQLLIPIEQQLRERSSETAFDFIVSLEDVKWQGLSPRYEPARVSFRGEIRSRHVPVKLTLIPLWFFIPPNWPSDQYEIVLEDRRDQTQSVDLLVPVGKSAMPTNTDVRAALEVDETMLPPDTPVTEGTPAPAAEPSPHIQKVRFVFNEGFEDVRVVGTPPTVKFRILKRSAAAGGESPAG